MRLASRRGRHVFAVLTGLVALVLPAGAAAGAQQPAGVAPLGRQLDALVAAGAPGAILFVRNGDRTATLARGVGDVARATPMRVDDRFRVASLTKTYVATVILQMAREGKLGLADTVESHLPGLVPNGGAITIEQLLNHTSGIPEFELDPRVLEPFLNGDLGHHWAPRDLVEIAVSHEPTFAPGAGFAYSNTNYVLAGLIVEQVTGRSLGRELRRRIFVPLRLRATMLATTPAMPRPHAHGYRVLGEPPAVDITGLNPYPWAAGAIVSTVGELATFYRALLRGRLLARPQLAAMKQTIREGTKVDIPGQRYGLGLERFPTRCGGAWGHNGDIPGYFTYLFSSGDGRRQAVLTVNQDAMSLPREAGGLFFKVITNAYCAGA
jgi:D-alanyl-D-alanine carboxypeptidase